MGCSVSQLMTGLQKYYRLWRSHPTCDCSCPRTTNKYL